jgi:tetratricopeptide (TPR) repeat protein
MVNPGKAGFAHLAEQPTPPQWRARHTLEKNRKMEQSEPMRTACFGSILALVALGLLLGTALAGPEPDAKEPFDQGVAALTQGNSTLAVEKFTAALKIDPKLLEAYINRGIAEMSLSLWGDAVGDFDQAIELDPNSPEAFYNRALAYSRQNVFDKALADYTQAAKLAPEDWQIYYNRGNTYLDMKKAPEALNDYNRALKLHPPAPEILHNRSLAYLALEKPEPALADADKVLALDPNYIRAYYAKGQALEKLGNKYEALAAYRHFLKNANPDADAHLLQKALERIKVLEASK